MALTWGKIQLTAGGTRSEILQEFFTTVLPNLNYWQNFGGTASASVLFDGGAAGGIFERVSGFSPIFAWYYTPGSSSDVFANSYVPLRSATLAPATELFALIDKERFYTSKTKFFGQSASTTGVNSISGTFQPGETITFDSGGSPVTATLEAMFGIDGISFTPTSVDPSFAWNTYHNKSVTGGTSGATATTNNNTGAFRLFQRAKKPTSMFLQSASGVPQVSDTITGGSSGAIATITSVNSITYKISFSYVTMSQFQHGETVTYGGSNYTANALIPDLKWVDGIACEGNGTGSNLVINTNTAYYAEDQTRLILLIPNDSNNDFLIFMAGQWYQDLRGISNPEAVFCMENIADFTSSVQTTTQPYVILDAEDKLWIYGGSALGAIIPQPLVYWNSNTQARVEYIITNTIRTTGIPYKKQLLGGTTSSGTGTIATLNEPLFISRGFVFGDSVTFKDVINPSGLRPLYFYVGSNLYFEVDENFII